MKKLAISKLPSAGLGNKLFSWAAGALFAHLNQCPHYIVGMTRVHLGTFLRKERSKRFYFGYFKNEVISLFGKGLFLKKYTLPQKAANITPTESGLYIFSEITHWTDHFVTLKDYRKEVLTLFWNGLSPKVTTQINLYPAPAIALHIRMGDFRELKEGEDFAKVGAVRTPLSYFEKIIAKIRAFVDWEVPVTIFSNGSDEELREILTLPNVVRAEEDMDIVHLAVLSKSSVIVMSAGSSFSFWAGFLSDGILINHYNHIYKPIRSPHFNQKVYEGPFNPNHDIATYPLLAKNLSSKLQKR